ncbi:MAG: extracellular solute-binding protein [Microlunatus sp.]|nr:extracellular solute-binding protein [Microlunatus sp.]
MFKEELSMPALPDSRQRGRHRARSALAIAISSATILAITACTNSAKNPADNHIGGVANISVFAPQGADQNLATNTFTKEMEKKFNIKFTFQTTTQDAGPAAEKRQITLASGDYPDMFLLIPWVDQFNQVDVEKLAKQGIAVPLNDLIKQYAPHIQKALDTNANFKAMATSPDGKIYGLPQLVECYHCSYAAKLWMNTAWLKKLNLPMPKTTEDMMKTLEAFKNNDPNGNGKKDEIPLSADAHDNLIPYFMNAFIYDPQDPDKGITSTLVLRNGKVDIQANQEGWREGLRYIKSLWDAGLIDKGAFTQNPEALNQEGNNAGSVILGSATVLHPYIFVNGGSKDGRDKDYDAVPPLTGPSGAHYAAYTYPAVPGATFMLTNKATKNDQVAAIKLMDYIFTDQGQIDGTFGVEGKDWTKPGPKDKALDPNTKPLYNVVQQPAGAKPRNSAWGALAQYNNTLQFRNAQVEPENIYDPSGYERRLFQATKLYQGNEDKAEIYPFWDVWVDPANASEVATLQTNIDNYTMQNALAFITGSKSLDTDWNAYVQGFQGLGLPRYLQLLQTAYNKSAPK